LPTGSAAFAARRCRVSTRGAASVSFRWARSTKIQAPDPDDTFTLLPRHLGKRSTMICRDSRPDRPPS